MFTEVGSGSDSVKAFLEHRSFLFLPTPGLTLPRSGETMADAPDRFRPGDIS
jgi:hypothetical protein